MLAPRIQARSSHRELRVTGGTSADGRVSIYSVEGSRDGRGMAFGILGAGSVPSASGHRAVDPGIRALVLFCAGAWHVSMRLPLFRVRSIGVTMRPLRRARPRKFPLRMRGTVIAETAMAGSLRHGTGRLPMGLSITTAFATYTWLYCSDSWALGMGGPFT